MNKDVVIFNDDKIILENYKFRPSNLSDNFIIIPSEINNVDWECTPPVIRLKTNEIIFISSEYSNSIKNFCKNNNIIQLKLRDIWELLLEPFLDNWFDKSHKMITYKVLQEYGISRFLCNIIRLKVSLRMYYYNFFTGIYEGVYLGHYDLLDAYYGSFTNKLLKLSNNKYIKFYWWTMNIALKGMNSYK